MKLFTPLALLEMYSKINMWKVLAKKSNRHYLFYLVYFSEMYFPENVESFKPENPAVKNCWITWHCDG